MEDDSEFMDRDCSTTCCLPDEIFTRVFTFLRLEDRKSVRLVCRHWHYCSTRSQITKNEKFVIRSAFSINEIRSVMQKSTVEQLNLEFQSLWISRLPASTWKVCGRQIRSLELFNCHWTDGTIKNIIMHCENMTSFTAVTVVNKRTDERNPNNILCSPGLLTELAKKGVRRTKLHTFAIFTDEFHKPEGVLSEISFIYPCVKHFGAGVTMHINSVSYCHDACSMRWEQPMYPVLGDECLNTYELESFTMNVPNDGQWIKTCTTNEKNGFRLKHFETAFSHNAFMDETLRNFFSFQKELNVVRLRLEVPKEQEWNNEAVKETTFHILERCPNLREFRLNFYPWRHKLNLTWEDLPKFVALISKLQFLFLDFDIISACPYKKEKALKSLLPSKNFALTTFKLEDRSELGTDFCSTFFQNCPSLRHLQLRCGNDTLQIIFKYLPKLETLVIHSGVDLTDYGFIGHDATREGGYSIKRLQQLKYLNLRYSDTTNKLTDKFVSELQLPRLEFLALNMNLYKELSNEMLIQLAAHVPELKELVIYETTDVCLAKTTLFCQHCNRLQYLIYTETKFDVKDVEEIFKACPTLKCISSEGDITFLFNPFSRIVLRKCYRNFKFHQNVFGDDDVCLY